MIFQHVASIVVDAIVAEVTVDAANDVLADPVDALFPLWKRFQLGVSCCTRSYLDVVANTANFVIKKLL